MLSSLYTVALIPGSATVKYKCKVLGVLQCLFVICAVVTGSLLAWLMCGNLDYALGISVILINKYMLLIPYVPNLGSNFE